MQFMFVDVISLNKNSTILYRDLLNKLAYLKASLHPYHIALHMKSRACHSKIGHCVQLLYRNLSTIECQWLKH